DIAELKREAEAGDEEAKKALEEDPLTEDEDDAFIIEFFRRLFRLPRPEPEQEPATEADAETAEPEEPRARIPFGPFLILAVLEALFARDLVMDVFRRLLP